MRILANAHISRALLEFVRGQGCDCVHAELLKPGLSDDALLEIAVRENRVILTADKDFGELVFRRRVPAAGVILIRFRAASEADRVALFERHWPAIEPNAEGNFVVVTDRSVRRSPLGTMDGTGLRDVR